MALPAGHSTLAGHGACPLRRLGLFLRFAILLPIELGFDDLAPPRGRFKSAAAVRFARYTRVITEQVRSSVFKDRHPSCGMSMCEKCRELDDKIERYSRIAQSITDELTVEGIKHLIDELRAEKDRLHPNEQ